MFRRKVQTLTDVLGKALRDGGLETPLLQKRIVDAWDVVVGPTVSRYTQQKYIRNQTLCVKIISGAAPRPFHDAHTARQRLNEHVGSFVIAEVRIY